MPSPAIAIRRASIKDLDALAPLFDAYRAFYEQANDLEAGRAFLRDRLEREQAVVFAGEVRSQLAGFALLYPTFTSVRLGSEWILNDLFVSPPHRRLGLGRLLVEACMDHARQTGAISLELLTEVDNSAAQALYESLGWKRTTEFYRYTYST